jgi:hypothetical protein
MVQAGHVQADDEGEAQDWKRTTRGDTTLLMSENNNSIKASLEEEEGKVVGTINLQEGISGFATPPSA